MNPGVFAATTAVPTATATTAAMAAAEAERRRRWEEETLTTYSRKDLDEDWEFKILHSARGAFKDPDRLREILEEEARAGWVLVEKFDNSRVRLKRAPEARRNDRDLSFDPWRSYVGPTSTQHEARIALIVVGIVLAVASIVLVVILGLNGPPG